MVNPVRFDDALPLLIEVLCRRSYQPSLENGDIVILRDISGTLTVIVRNPGLFERVSALSEELRRLVPYVEDHAVATPQDLFDDALHSRSAFLSELIKTSAFGDVAAIVIDRRMVGADWLSRPRNTIEGAPPIATFWSMKGGVGRTTALAVCASALARGGHDILVVDLDLEAPGIGKMLLNHDNAPRYGALDFFVENKLGMLDDDFLAAMVSPSTLTRARGGTIDIVPAVGTITDVFPENMLAKLARAYMDLTSITGSVAFIDQVRELILRLSRRRSYDAILVDARAGLNESAAASLLGLGAFNLLFGINTPQTFADYRYALAHLSKFVRVEEGLWRSQLQMVHARASFAKEEPKDDGFREVKAGAAFVDRSFDIFADFLYEETTEESVDEYNFDVDDPDAPHNPWVIYDDSTFKEFDPLTHPWQLDARPTEAAFGEFVDRFISRLLPNQSIRRSRQ